MGIPDIQIGELRLRVEKLENALREIDVSHNLPDHFDPAEWWKHVASKRREIARNALNS